MKSIFKIFCGLTVLVSYSDSTLASLKLDDGGVCPFPSYPKISINSREEGMVDFAMHIDESGSVTAVEIIKSSGFKNLDDATEKNFRRCKFPPKVLVPPNKEWVKHQAFIWRID